ncbi:MAG: hypothetical protein DWG82_03475 [Chloroflexi bacterium]|nr:hypothetical protein [Chloroflexota bacterium]
MNFRPPEVWIVSGPVRAERSALARDLADHLGHATHVDGEALWDQIVAGRADRAADEAEAERQYELSIRNQCLLARSYAEAGFTPVLDFPVTTAYHLDAYRNYLAGGRIHLVLLARIDEFEGLGLLVGSDAEVTMIVQRQDDALLPPLAQGAPRR